MAAIIKNQILKHLSRYVKDLSSDKINLSTFKGEGELKDLNLQEDVLTELLALPTWMKLTHAKCNHVLIKIPWTKLKTVPIHLSLDEVSIRVEATEELRKEGENPNIPPMALGKYGFVNKVIDGITATVNSVEITFHSQDFESKVQISRIRVESRSPDWHKIELQGTRLKDLTKGETLIFKEMSWQTLRLEARSTSDRHLAPLRLLTNQAKARIVIKKKLSDCQVVGCRLSLILDDLLWVLTDSQILGALHFMSSLSGLVKQATEITQRYKAKRKLESLPEYQAQQTQTNAMDKSGATLAKKFDAYDVKETSYHFVCEKIDLHFCDDPGTGRSQHPDLKDGGALQASLTQVRIDFYPYHLAKGSRRSWPKYTDNTLSQWLHQALQSFKISLMETLSSSSMHTPLTRAHPQGMSQYQPGTEHNVVKDAVTSQLGKLMSTCIVLIIQDFRLFRVTTSSKRTAPLPFISTFIERPKDLPVIHSEFTWFYYPGEMCFPLPRPKVYAYLHPIQIHLDVCTILWLSKFVSNLQHAMMSVNPPAEPDNTDVRVELIMPKVVFENTTEYPLQKDRPKSLHFQVSRLVLANYRSNDTGTLHQLTQCLELLQRGDLVYGTDFPSKESDVPLLAEKFVQHAEGQDKLGGPKKLNCSSFRDISNDLTKDMMWNEPRDIWYICMDPFWAEFHVEAKRRRFPSETGSASFRKKSMSREESETRNSTSTVIYPFVDALPLSAWIYINEKDRENSKLKKKSIQAVLSANGTLKAQLSHYQFLFIMRMVEALGEMSLYLTLDLESIMGKGVLDNLVTFVGLITNVEVSLLFPPSIADKQNSPSVDLDSIIPESISGETEPTNRDEKEELDLHRSLVGASFLPRASLASNPMSMSNSPLTKNLGGGSNPTLCAGTGEGFKGLGQSVKHSLTNLAVSFNVGGGISTPDSEIASNWSNFSSDTSSDNFVQLDVTDPDASSGRVAIFRTEGGQDDDLSDGVEVATEVVEERDLVVEERSTPSPVFPQGTAYQIAENEQMTAVLTVVLDGLEIAQEAKGLSTILKLQCKSVAIKECTGMNWNEFQKTSDLQEANFEGRNRDGDEMASATVGSPTQRRAVKLRLTQDINGDSFLQQVNSEEVLRIIKEIKTPACPRINLLDRPGTQSPLRNAIFDSTTAFLDAKVDLRNDSKFLIHMSSCIGLADFVEDEIIPNPFPLQLELMGLSLELIEDRPSANITSPGPVPIKVTIPNVLPIARDKHGVFHIGCNSPQASTLNASQQSQSSLSSNTVTNGSLSQTGTQADIETLQKDLERTLRQLNSAQEKNAALEKELESNELLKVMVVQLQEQVSKLQDERSSRLSKQSSQSSNHYNM